MSKKLNLRLSAAEVYSVTISQQQKKKNTRFHYQSVSKSEKWTPGLWGTHSGVGRYNQSGKWNESSSTYFGNYLGWSSRFETVSSRLPQKMWSIKLSETSRFIKLNVPLILVQEHHDQGVKWEEDNWPDTWETGARIKDKPVRSNRHCILWGKPLWFKLLFYGWILV